MINGIGFSEMVMIAVVVLLFFGSKELPRFLREAGKFVAKIRRYSDMVRNELQEVTSEIAIQDRPISEVSRRKQEVRERSIIACNALTPQECVEKSGQIAETFLHLESIEKVRNVMVYIAGEKQVQTKDLIVKLLTSGKRVIVPYLQEENKEIGIAEIKNPEQDLVSNIQTSLLEPRKELQRNFLKSDLEVVVCPGVAFDRFGGRLGSGDRLYDLFLKELKSRIPLVGFGFQCQMLKESLPFDYHDIPMDIIISEEGIQYRIQESTS